MTRTVHKKIEITEEYTDGGSNFKIIFGILLGIGIGAALIYYALRTKKITESTRLSIEPDIGNKPARTQPLLLIDNQNNEKWKIIRNESGGIEEIEILKGDIKNYQSNVQNNTQNNIVTQPDNVDTIILKPENTNIHKRV